MHGTEAVESRGRIALAQFNWRAIILAKDTTVHDEISGDIQGVWGGGETVAESVGRLDYRADAENAEPLVSRDPRAWAEWSHAPEPFV